MILLASALVYSGCTALCLAMNRHFQQVLPGRKPQASILLILRILGWFLLALGTASCAYAQGYAVGSVLLFGLLSAALFLLILLLTYAPRAALVLALVGPVAGLML